MKILEKQETELKQDLDDLEGYLQELIVVKAEEIQIQEDKILEENNVEEYENEKTEKQTEEEMRVRDEEENKNEQSKLKEKQQINKSKEEKPQINESKEEKPLIKVKNPEIMQSQVGQKAKEAQPQAETEKELDELDSDDIFKFFESSVNQINFSFKNGKPVYSVVMNISGNNQEYNMIGWDNIERTREQRVQYLKKIVKSNKVAYRSYDLNIEKILRRVDSYYGTDALNKYFKLMQASSREEIEAIDFKINYDFSNLNRSPKGLQNKLKLAYMKRLAKTNAKSGKASYEKEPNFLKRMYNRIKSLKLDSPDANKQNYNAEYMEKLMESREKYQSTDESIREALISGMDDPEFSFEDVAEFYGKTPEEINTYVKEIKNMQSKNKSKSWRKKYEVSEDELQLKLKPEKEQNNKKDNEMQH